MTRRDAFIAVNRFGLGAAKDELRDASADPKGWIIRQLSGVPVLPDALAGFNSSDETIAAFQAARRRARRNGDKAMLKAQRKALRNTYLREASSLIKAQIETEAPVVERLVSFWSNHFTVSVRKPIVTGVAGAFEREAIRPHILGRFSDMLHAAVRHPAMLAYLDNVQSVGPNSIVGTRRRRGLNENLAREILELHTLGVDGGYTQSDVLQFAKVLTGWSVSRKEGEGAFAFQARAHEPGAKRILGKRYAEAGMAEGAAVLDDLARHPATARHVAFKLARHFTADLPAEKLIRRLSGVFRETDGDLRAVTKTLAGCPEVWVDPLPKVKTPVEFVVSTMRATGHPENPKRLYAVLRLLGQAPYTAPSPAGWPDEAAKWISPHALMQRAELAMCVGRKVRKSVDSMPLFERTISPVAAASTRAAIDDAPSKQEAIATLFASPEFQRR